MKGKETAEAEKFRDYYDYSETIRTIPSHRALALFGGERLLRLDRLDGHGVDSRHAGCHGSR